MSLFQQLLDLLKTLFEPSNPENIRHQQLKKIEMNLSKIDQPFYKNGEVQPVVAEAFFILYKNTSVIYRVLDFMAPSEDSRFKARLFDILIQTGYMDKSKKKLESLAYEMRKEALYNSGNQQRELESQGQCFVELQKELQLNAFVQIEQTLKDLELFYDLCSFNFVSILKIFNPNFDPMAEKSKFSPVPKEKLSACFLDLYYVTAKLELTGSLVRAIIALLSIAPGKNEISSADDVMNSMKKIATVINKILTPTVLKDLIALGKNDPNIEPKFSVIKTSPLEDYIVRDKVQFFADEQRLKIEFQDHQMSRKIKTLFGSHVLLDIKGYDAHQNKVLKEGSAVTFLWITPLQIIKTFFSLYLEEEVHGLLDDIVLEGFFNTPDKKTEFSSTIFACLDIGRVFAEFESSFSRNEKNDIVLLLSYLQDSQKDSEFSRNLSSMVNAINNEAKNIVQAQVSFLYDLYKLLLDLSEDARKSTPEIISNIKFLFTSSRNRGRVEFLEKSLPKWAAFLSLMKNYAVIGQIETSREESRQQN